jgi:hypothetical protein
LHALNIDIICANSSPAKGRVERANKTLQDRLVKELRWRVLLPWRKVMLYFQRSSVTATRALPKRRRTARICIGDWALATISMTRLPGRKSAPYRGH